MIVVGGFHHSGLSIRRVSDMDNGRHDSGELSIPSFATERCRAMTGNLIRTLESIPPTDDGALEDRALACFVVACGELALMRSTGHRDTVVEQLTAVARKLVTANAAIPKPKVVPNKMAPNQAQGLAQVLMRGLVRDAAPEASKAPALLRAQGPRLELTVDPPEIPAWGAQNVVAQEDVVRANLAHADLTQEDLAQQDLAQEDLVQEDIASHRTAETETIQAETIRAETVQATIEAETVEDKSVQDQSADSEAVPVKTVEAETGRDETVQDGTVQDETVEDQAVEDKTVHADTRDDQATPVETIDVEVAETKIDSPSTMSWDELEALIKQEVAEIGSNAPVPLDAAAVEETRAASASAHI
jgi:hypothetical protein